jgi:hypothetical protein
VGADADVVTDLDLVVQLDAILDDGIAEGPPRSIVVPAPTSTSSPIRTRPVCGIFTQADSSSRAKPKPSAPTTAPLWIRQRLPIRQPAYTTTLAANCVAAPMTAPLPMLQLGPITAPSPTSAPGPIQTFAPTLALAATFPSTTADECTPGDGGGDAFSH